MAVVPEMGREEDEDELLLGNGGRVEAVEVVLILSKRWPTP